MLANPDCSLNKSEIAEVLGIEPETLYRWLLDSGFSAEVDRLSRLYAEAERALIRKSVIAGCRSGDARSIKLFFELQGASSAACGDPPLSDDDRALLNEAIRLLTEQKQG